MNNILRLLTVCINTDLIVLRSVTDGLEEKHGTYLYLRPFCFLVDSASERKASRHHNIQICAMHP